MVMKEEAPIEVRVFSSPFWIRAEFHGGKRGKEKSHRIMELVMKLYTRMC